MKHSDLRSNYPNLYDLINHISIDMFGLEAEVMLVDQFSLGPYMMSDLDEFEVKASLLTDEEKQQFAIGEHYDQIELKETHNLWKLDEFLTEIYDGCLTNELFPL